MGEVETVILIVVFRAVINSIWILTTPIIGIEQTQLGVDMPLLREVIAMPHIERITPIRTRLHARIAPRFGIIEIEIHDACLRQTEPFAQRIVL